MYYTHSALYMVNSCSSPLLYMPVCISDLWSLVHGRYILCTSWATILTSFTVDSVVTYMNFIIAPILSSFKVYHGLKILLHKHITFKECLKVLWDNYCRNEQCYEWDINHSFRDLTTLWISVLVQKINLLSVTTVHHRNRRNSESLTKYRATKSFLLGSWYSSEWKDFFFQVLKSF